MSETPPTPELLARVTARHGTPAIATLPNVGPDLDTSAVFERLRQFLSGARVVLFSGVAPEHLDAFFHLRLAQLSRREPPFLALSIVVLRGDPDQPPPAGGFGDRFRSGWPFASGIFLTEAADPAPLAATLGLTVARLDGEWTPERCDAPANQAVAVQLQSIWGRCGSTTGFENQVESLVRAGYFTIRLFTDVALRRGATLAEQLPRIIAENGDHAGAHIDALAVPDGPPFAIRARDHEVSWSSVLAATTSCRVRNAAVVEAMQRADAVVANRLETVGPALVLAPRARLMLDPRDDRARQVEAMMRRAGQPEVEVASARAATARAQAAVLAIPDLCGHVSAAEFAALGKHCQRAAIVLPRVYASAAPATVAPVHDVLVFGDEHPWNIMSARWFLDEVWRPYLEDSGVSVAIAGRVGDHLRDLATGNLTQVLGFVEDLDALRAACRLTVVPDRAGTGTAVKMLATLAAGHPLVSTSVGLRGLDPSIAAILPARDEPAVMAADILNLLDDPDSLLERRDLVRLANEAIRRGPDHAALLRQVPRPTPRVRREREARWAGLTAAAIRPDPRPFLFGPGVAFPMSGTARDHHVLLSGWHGPEQWGRWTDGVEASLLLQFPAPAMDPLALELDIVPSPAGASLSLAVDAAWLPPVTPVRGRIAWDLPFDATRGRSSLVITLRISAAHCPARSGGSTDARILGIGVSSVRVLLPDA